MGSRAWLPEVTRQLKRAAGSIDKVCVFVRVFSYVFSNRTRTAGSFDFAITRMTSDQITLHTVQLLLFTAFPPAVISFPRLQPIFHFPVLSANQIILCISSQLHVFPRFFPVTCTILGSDCCSSLLL